jgi:hypothetical protein
LAPEALVVTVISTMPAAPAGAATVIWLGLLEARILAAVLPNLTAVAPDKFVPVMTTEAPPAMGPEAGLTPVMVGAVRLCAGTVAVIVVGFTTVTPVAAVEPKYTADPEIKLVPVIVTVAPPAGKPPGGATALTVGAADGAAVKVALLRTVAPAEVVRMTS